MKRHGTTQRNATQYNIAQQTQRNATQHTIHST